MLDAHVLFVEQVLRFLLASQCALQFAAHLLEPAALQRVALQRDANKIVWRKYWYFAFLVNSSYFVVRLLVGFVLRLKFVLLLEVLQLKQS